MTTHNTIQHRYHDLDCRLLLIDPFELGCGGCVGLDFRTVELHVQVFEGAFEDQPRPRIGSLRFPKLLVVLRPPHHLHDKGPAAPTTIVARSRSAMHNNSVSPADGSAPLGRGSEAAGGAARCRSCTVAAQACSVAGRRTSCDPRRSRSPVARPSGTRRG